MSKPTRVLIVEDEIIIARELELRLSALGYKVAGIASDADEAVALAVAERPDLVLMDIVLKGDRDGIEAATEIRRRQSVPHVYLTAYADEATLARAQLTEPLGYIIKPYSERELRANIEMALYKHKTEERIRASLLEKEVLLREIHHRVKNNLQVVSSLLYLQSKHLADASGREMFDECRARVRSMSLIHEHLYRAQNLAAVDFAEYIRQLTAELTRTYRMAARVRLALDVEPIELPLDTAIPCGLLVNELVTNSFKHAFPADAGGSLRVSFRRGPGEANVLTVADDGVGLPATFDPQATHSFGMKLINTLVRQLEGKCEVASAGGLTVTITIPAHSPTDKLDLG